MNTRSTKAIGIVFILITILMVTFSTQSISYAQEANPTLTASVEEPLTEATLHASVITLTISGGRLTDREWDIRDALTISGMEGITIVQWPFLNRVSDTEVYVPLLFAGNIDTNATLTFTMGAGAIVDYNGKALTATLSVTAVEESLKVSTESPLTEATLNGSIITLTLTGRQFVDEWSMDDALSVSGIDRITFEPHDVDRISNTVATVKLTFFGNIDSDDTFTLTVGADAIVGYNKAFTFQFHVTAIEESLEASTEQPLTEATLNGSIITLTLNGRQFVGAWDIDDALSFSGIDGVTINRWDVDRVSDTEVAVPLEFAGNIDTDATLTLTIGPNAIIGGYDKDFTFEFPVTAVEESLVASTAASLAEVSQFPFSLTEAPLTEATLNGGIITLTLTGRRFVSSWDIERALSISGIDGVTVNDVYRGSDTVAIVELKFAGNIDSDATLTLTVGADAIGYNKDFTFEFPVTAVEESLEPLTESPLTEATLNGGTIVLTLTGRRFPDHWYDGWYSGNPVSVSGIDGVTLASYSAIDRVSDTVAIFELDFVGNIDEDATLTLTVGADVIGYDKDFTFEFTVTAVEESLEPSTEVPLTEAMLDGGTITLTLTGRQFNDDPYEIEDALLVYGIYGVTLAEYGAVRHVSDTEIIVELRFSGNIDEDATLTLIVGPDAIGYNKTYYFDFPVTPVEESLEASTEFPLTEATLDSSIITLSLNGRRFADRLYRNAFSVSGIEGVTVARYGAIDRVNDTEATVELQFDGTDFDTDATLTFTVEAEIANYDQAFTAQVPVTAIKQSNATVSIAPSPVISPNIGEPLTLNLNITGGENVAGYQATVSFDVSALEYMESANGDYLPVDAFFLASYDSWDDEVTLTSNTLSRSGNGDGTLATLTFKGVDFKASTLTLSEVYFVDADGKRWEVATQSAEVTIPPELDNAILEDINRDGVVNIQDLVIVSARFGLRGYNSADINGDRLVDIVDLVLVASAVNAAAAAPPLNPQALDLLTVDDVQGWLSQARQLTRTDPAYLRGIATLELLLKTLTPKKTLLLPNYPNPFNPETWIPYHLSNDVDLQISIYDTKGVLVRRLDLGHQMAGYYTTRTKAAYWDGKNAFGEQVASGVYFYHLSAGDYSATRKMLILK